MLLNYNKLVLGGYFANDIDNDAFSLELKALCNEFKGLPVVVNEIETKGVTVEGKTVYLNFDDNGILSYLRYCINFIESYKILDFLDFRDFIDFWYQEGLTKNQYTRKGFHTIAFDNYSECIKFYAVVYYIAELYLGY